MPIIWDAAISSPQIPVTIPAASEADLATMRFSRIALIIGLTGAAILPHLLFMRQPFSIDEAAIVRNIIQFLSEKTLIPFHVNYPTFFSYLATPFIAIGALLDGGAASVGTLPDSLAYVFVLHPLEAVLPARLLSVLLLLASAVVIYRMIALRKGALAGAVAGAILLLSPSLLHYGSYALPDVALLAFSNLSFALLLTFAEQYPEKGSVRSLAISSACAGLAISCKYDAATTVIPIVVAVVILKVQGRLEPGRLRRLLDIAALCCVVAFFAGSPGWLLAPLWLLAGLLFEIRHAAHGHLGASGVPVLGQLELLATQAPVMLLAALAGIGVWWRNRTAGGWLALSALLANLALASLSSKQSIQYLYSGYVGWLYFAGVFADAAVKAARLPALAAFAAAGVLLYGHSITDGLAYRAPNTTKLAERWIYRNIRPGALVATDWAYVPYLYSTARLDKLRASFGRRAAPIIRAIDRSKITYDLVGVKYDSAWLTRTTADYFVTSNFVFQRFFCTGLFTGMVPGNRTPLRTEFNQRKAFYTALFRSNFWRLAKTFETGNGPKTYIFAKKRPATEQDATVVPKTSLPPKCL